MTKNLTVKYICHKNNINKQNKSFELFVKNKMYLYILWSILYILMIGYIIYNDCQLKLKS